MPLAPAQAPSEGQAPSPAQASPDPSKAASEAKAAAFKRDLEAAKKASAASSSATSIPPRAADKSAAADAADDDEPEESDEDGVDDEGDDEGATEGDDDSDALETSSGVEAARAALERGDLDALAKALGHKGEIKVDKAAFRALKKLEQKAIARAAKIEQDLAKREKELKDTQAQIDKAIGDIGPALKLINDYDRGRGDKSAGARGVEKLLGVPFAQLARDFYEYNKAGPLLSHVEKENKELRARLDRIEHGSAEKEQKAAAEKKQAAEVATFSKSYQKHPLAELDENNELRDRALKAWRDSWDADLESHSLSRKEALDQVYAKEKRRLERIAGKSKTATGRVPTLATSESADKSYKSMTKEERRAYDLRLALDAASKSKSDRRTR